MARAKAPPEAQYGDPHPQPARCQDKDFRILSHPGPASNPNDRVPTGALVPQRGQQPCLVGGHGLNRGVDRWPVDGNRSHARLVPIRGNFVSLRGGRTRGRKATTPRSRSGGHSLSHGLHASASGDGHRQRPGTVRSARSPWPTANLCDASTCRNSDDSLAPSVRVAGHVGCDANGGSDRRASSTRLAATVVNWLMRSHRLFGGGRLPVDFYTSRATYNDDPIPARALGMYSPNNLTSSRLITPPTRGRRKLNSC